MSAPTVFRVEESDFAKGGGLVPVVAQDATTGAVLMVAYADREALERSLASGFMHYRSRTRGLWKKGETSGHVQRVISLAHDCDRDAVLARVLPEGPACHTNAPTCFGAPQSDELSTLASTIAARACAPVEGSYTSRLLSDRNLRLKKLGEEMAELILALADADPRRVAEEAADVVYHLLVALQANGSTLDDVRTVLRARAARR